MMIKDFRRIDTDTIIDCSQIMAVRLSPINKTQRKEGYQMWVELPHRSFIVPPDFECVVLNYCDFEIVKSHNDQYVLQHVTPDFDY